jgi:hypothetical protein
MATNVFARRACGLHCRFAGARIPTDALLDLQSPRALEVRPVCEDVFRATLLLHLL